MEFCGIKKINIFLIFIMIFIISACEIYKLKYVINKYK